MFKKFYFFYTATVSMTGIKDPDPNGTIAGPGPLLVKANQPSSRYSRDAITLDNFHKMNVPACRSSRAAW
jgi:hypothetical protein